MLQLSSDAQTTGPGIQLAITPSAIDAVPAFSSLSYNGVTYATLANTPYNGLADNSMDYFAALPTNWVVAEDSDDARAVISLYGWGADLVVLSNGKARFTNNSGTSGSYYAGDGTSTIFIQRIGSRYSCSVPNKSLFCQILLRRRTSSGASTGLGIGNITDRFKDIAIAFIVAFVAISGMIYM